MMSMLAKGVYYLKEATDYALSSAVFASQEDLRKARDRAAMAYMAFSGSLGDAQALPPETFALLDKVMRQLARSSVLAREDSTDQSINVVPMSAIREAFAMVSKEAPR